jgi:hypothetical protein
MKKKLLMMLVPVVLLMAGALAVWGDEQKAVQPGCGNCAKIQQVQADAPKAAAPAPCANCPNAAKVDGAPCPNCAKLAADAKPAAGCDKCAKAAAAPAGCDKCAKGAAMQPGCGNCAKLNAAEVAPPAAGCSKCAKLQQPDQQPAVQPIQKGCCNKQKAL